MEQISSFLQKNKSGIIRLFAVISVLVMLAVCFGGITYVTRNKENAGMWDAYLSLPQGSVSTLFVGNSHSFCSIDTDLLYEEYNLDSFMLSASGQTTAMSYYAIREALKTQSPERIYLELSYTIHDWNVINDEMSHMFFDGMPNDEVKREALADLVEEGSRIWFYLPLGQYHSRFTTLTEADYKGPGLSERGRFYSETVVANREIPVVPAEEKLEIPENNLKYMDLIVELCEQEGIELILYVAPYNALYPDDEALLAELERSQRIYNSLEDYADSRGVSFWNGFRYAEEIGFDYGADFLDTQHMNCYGQDKFTRFMTECGVIKVE